jgi:hypothetical protein
MMMGWEGREGEKERRDKRDEVEREREAVGKRRKERMAG